MGSRGSNDINNSEVIKKKKTDITDTRIGYKWKLGVKVRIKAPYDQCHPGRTATEVVKWQQIARKCDQKFFLADEPLKIENSNFERFLSHI